MPNTATPPTTAELLKFANLQMAAEALFGFDANTQLRVPGARVSGALEPGNLLIEGNWGQNPICCTSLQLALFPFKSP
jgi:hypothetical protein